MNDGLILGDLGREHHNDLVREADRERLAREVEKRTPNRFLAGLRSVLLKSSNSVR